MGVSIERVEHSGPQLVLVTGENRATVYKRDRGQFSWAEPGVYRRITCDGYVTYTAVDHFGRMRLEISVMVEDDSPVWRKHIEHILGAIEIPQHDANGLQLRLL